MVEEKIIFDIIEKSIIDTVKCNTSGTARKRGVGAEFSYNSDVNSYDIVYPDGTLVQYDDDDGLVSVSIDGKKYDFPGKKDSDYEYEMFEYMKQQLSNMEGILGYSTMYNFVRAYFDDFASYLGWAINGALRDGTPLEDAHPRIHQWNDILVDGHDAFVDLEHELRIDNEDYACIRLQSNMNHGNDSIDKKVISDKAHTCTTVGGDWTKQVINFTETMSAGDSWKVITVVDKGSGVTGLFAGNPLRDERGRDWEAEVNFAPKQKFERLLIDEENKIIIQKPVVK